MSAPPSSPENPACDASVMWSPTRLTSFTLRAATFVNPTTDPDSAGSILYDAELKAEMRSGAT